MSATESTDAAQGTANDAVEGQATTDAAEPATGQQDPSHDGPDWKAEARKWEDRSKTNLAEKAAIEQKLAAITQALGLGETVEDPAKAAEQYKAAATLAEQKLNVYQATPAGVDANALLDSQTFLSSLDGVQDLAAHITQFVEANPRFKTGTPAGARDAAQRGQQATPALGFNEWIRSQ